MARAQFGAKPSVLRCSRCGRFVDWEDARLQIVCGCRPHLELPAVDVRAAVDADRPRIDALFVADFGRKKLAAFGEVVDAGALPTIVADMEGDLAGALAYRPHDGALQIVALATHPEWQRSGVGARLVDHVEVVAREAGVTRIAVATTNDNLPALYFYQRRGYHLTELRSGAIAAGSGSPLVGFAGIPIVDELYLSKPVPDGRR